MRMILSRRRDLVLLAIFVLTAIAVLTGVFRGKSEPAYHGKRLNYWLDQLQGTYPASLASFSVVSKGYRNPQEQESDQKLEKEALVAIHSLGTNCIPVLRERLRAKNSSIVRTTSRWMVNAGLKLGLLNDRNIPLSVEIRRGQALTAIAALAPLVDLDPLLPDLVAMSKDADSNVRITALFALKKIAPLEFEKLTEGKYPP
jgi:hypothetical protein